MAQPFGIGDVVGGRYRITHHVVTSADQDIVFQGIDQVLNREVSILLASSQNAKQVATSARELATGERDSEVQVLDLGLTEDRTYLISSQTDPNDLMDLIVPDAAPYVEPFFTDSLGSEIFGQSRVMEPETFDDDPEYYAGLQEASPAIEEHADADPRLRRRRPAFLDRVSESLNRRLGTDRDADRLQSPAGQPDESQRAAEAAAEAPTSAGPVPVPGPVASAAASSAAGEQTPHLTLHEDMEVVETRQEADADDEFGASADATGGLRASGPVSAEVPAVASEADSATPQAEAGSEAEVFLDGEEVIDDPPNGPVTAYDPAPGAGVLPSHAEGSRASVDDARDPTGHPSFTGLISVVPSGDSSSYPDRPSEPAGTAGPAAAVTGGSGAVPPAAAPQQRSDSSTAPRWLGLGALAVILLIAAVVAFFSLRGGDSPDTVADEDPDTTEGAEETPGTDEDDADDAPEDDSTTEDEDAQDDEDAEEDEEPAPISLASVSRLVVDDPTLNQDADGSLPNTVDGDTSTSWTSLSFGTPEFGGFTSQLALVVELEDPTEVNAVTLTQPGQQDGGSFEVLVNDSASLDGAEQVGSGTWNWTETTVELDDGAEGQYVIINTTALPERLDSGNPDLPYGLQVADIDIE